jgi:HK97 family phage major capsid protein
MSKNLRELQARRAKHVKAMRAINDAAAAAERDLTAEESTSFSAERTSLAMINASIEREQELIAEETRFGAVEYRGGEITGGEPGEVRDPKRGFRSMGDFAQAVRAAGNGPGKDKRLHIGAVAPTTYGSELSGQDGGFLVPPEFSKEIFTLSLTDDALLPLTDNTPIESNSMVFPKDETTPWGTDGVRAYWQAEASVATQTKPKLGTNILRLNKLMALVPLTDELLGDAPALGAYITPLMARSVRWKVNEGILNGLGNGQPLGAFQGTCAVVQAKDTGQATKTVSATNVMNMIARLPPGGYNGAIWLITPDALPSVFTLTLGNYPIYLPVGLAARGGIQLDPGAFDGVLGMLAGRPLYASQHVAAFSSQGDLSLVNLSWYRTITNAGGMETATSMHLYFDADATAFRLTFRVDGSPKIVNVIAQAKGSNTLSPFIQLQAR